MEPPPKDSQQRTAYHDLGVDELQGEPLDMSPAVVSVMEADVAKALWAEPEQGPEAEEESLGGAGDKKGDGDGDEKPPQQQQQDKAQAAAEGPQPQDGEQSLHRSTFTGLQLKELESIFQRSQYPDVFARKELALPMDSMEVSKPEKSDSAEQPF